MLVNVRYIFINSKDNNFLFVAGPSAEFSAHKLVKPRLFHGRSKREIFHTRENVSISNYSLQLTIKHVKKKNFFFLSSKIKLNSQKL